MIENIFEGIKFGDRFRTRNNHMVVFLHGQKETPRSRKIEYVFAHNGWGINSSIVYDNTGKSVRGKEYDIVSRWNDMIDEEKLEELADKYEKEQRKKWGLYNLDFDSSDIENAYKAGYRKAKEE